MPGSRLLLVRHGLIHANRVERWHGLTDSPLTWRGRSQARRLARKLAERRPHAVYSSPLARCMATATAIASRTGLDIIADEALREWSLGDWEGKKFGVLHTEHDFFRITSRDRYYAAPGGECVAEVASRMVEALYGIDRRHSSEDEIVVVTHGAALAAAMATLLDGDPTLWRNYSFANCSVSELALDPGPARLYTYNETL